MKRLLFLFLLLIVQLTLPAQADTVGIHLAYEKGMNFTEAQADSIAFYADYIDKAIGKITYPKAILMMITTMQILVPILLTRSILK